MAQTNVLVVEDESIVSKDIQHSLKKLGYHVVGAASTGEQAVAAATDPLAQDRLPQAGPLEGHRGVLALVHELVEGAAGS